MISGGALWVDNGWTTLQSADTPQGCANRQMAEQGARFWVCNAGQGATLGYTRFAGTVVYHSLAFGFVFDGATGVPNSYAWNTTTEESSGGTLRSLGASVDFSISVTDAQGTIGFSPSISLTPFSSSTETPESCVTQALDWLNGGTQTLCTSGSSSESGMRGNTSG
jgi:hypothetical protein